MLFGQCPHGGVNKLKGASLISLISSRPLQNSSSPCARWYSWALTLWTRRINSAQTSLNILPPRPPVLNWGWIGGTGAPTFHRTNHHPVIVSVVIIITLSITNGIIAVIIINIVVMIMFTILIFVWRILILTCAAWRVVSARGAHIPSTREMMHSTGDALWRCTAMKQHCKDA